MVTDRFLGKASRPRVRRASFEVCLLMGTLYPSIGAGMGGRGCAVHALCGYHLGTPWL